MKDYKVNTGLTIIPSALLPPMTLYCSMDIYKEFERLNKQDKSLFERLEELYKNDMG